MDREAWHAAVHGVTNSWTWLSDWTKLNYDHTVEVTNRFKGLELIDWEPEELWMEVCDIVQEAVIKKKKWKKAKWLSEQALQMAEKTSEAKGKGKKERYTLLNAEFQRIVTRDKKAFLCDQCKQIEENNRMGFLQENSRHQGNISWKFSSVQLLSHVLLFATPWIAAHQASLSMQSWAQ